jgi:hypothetical protein
MATATVASEYCTLPLQELRESPTNPRQHFDENSLQELAAYVPQAHKLPFVSLVILWPRTARQYVGSGGGRSERHIAITES